MAEKKAKAVVKATKKRQKWLVLGHTAKELGASLDVVDRDEADTVMALPKHDLGNVVFDRIYDAHGVLDRTDTANRTRILGHLAPNGEVRRALG